MASDEPSSIQTRASLLNRLQTGDDAGSWQEFYRIYGKLVRDFAIQAGLTDTEAVEVVQDTAVAMSRHLPEYHYDPKVCRFKTWLLNQTSWRIKDQLRKRNREEGRIQDGAARFNQSMASGDATSRTSALCRVPDPAAVDLDAIFETEWRRNLFGVALERVKSKSPLKQFQMFELLVIQEWPATEVARSLGVTLANVYVTKHRIAVAVRKETKALEKQLEQVESIGRRNPAATSS